ncbi:MAG TPA: recombinase family protein, partial [Verrucomicrobiae bacterium]
MDHKPFAPDRAPIIKMMFEKYATGDWSLADLVRFAGEHGLTTVPVRRRRTQDEILAEESEAVEIEKVSRPMTISYVHKILTNAFYTGRVLGNEGKYVASVSHEALIDDELYNKVQAMLKRKKVSLHYTQKLELPLRGMVRCADCGRVYTRRHRILEDDSIRFGTTKSRVDGFQINDCRLRRNPHFQPLIQKCFNVFGRERCHRL